MRLPLFVTRPRPWWALWLLAGVVYVVTVTANTAMDLSDHGFGLQMGLVAGLTTLLGFMIFMVCWILAVTGVWQWRKWPPGGLPAVALGPMLLIALLDLALSAGGLIWPQLRFGPDYGMDLPADARDFRGYFSRLKLGQDATDCFAFETTAEATKVLLAAHEFKESPPGSTPAKEMGMLDELGARGFPDLRTWPGVKCYQLADPKHSYTIEFITDETTTKVYIRMSAY